MINCTSKICGELRPAVQASHEHATLARSIKTAHAQFLPELLACCQAICAKFRLQKFDFVQTKFCRDFAAKHVDLDADLAFVEIDLFHRTDGTFHCAGSDLDTVAHGIIDFGRGNAVINAELGDFLLREGFRLGSRADKTGAAAGCCGQCTRYYRS